ncbi:MAG TPA: type I-D CRISPR-associated protein Cas7/Csc2 [candidate division WOR-3 bacterium]|uniref:Type I-D CRISPR-associated protein Cas7/Csc2 n=1 Tax=candidate division WOR-3 bacterium TaxID=2052148 RepID=A0A9C9K0L4_UNCW3|nr:type I-D CRISPR-associated protein Cas7/Csc2 [candidate division WOR-3 bacterium]
MTDSKTKKEERMDINTLLGDYLVEKPEPIIGAKTIQIFLIREILDYTALRTEDTKELNTVATPLSINSKEQISRVAFFASKQKAVESRELERMLRTAVEKQGGIENDKLELGDNNNEKKVKKIKQCYLKDKLCMECPRCVLYGATALSQEANIKHRIEYSTAFSLLPWDDIEETITFNAINDKNIMTGQALGSRYVVKPATIFPSIVTLKSVSREELILTIKTLLSAKSYGAETRIGGDIRNHIVGIAAGWEEIITPLEFTLELYDKKINIEDKTSLEIEQTVVAILRDYLQYTANPDKIKILDDKKEEGNGANTGNVQENGGQEIVDELKTVIDEARNQQLGSDFLYKIYKDVQKFRETQS